MSEERVDVRGILRIYFFLRVKKERRLGSSLEAEAGRVWDLPGPLSPEALIGEPNKKRVSIQSCSRKWVSMPSPTGRLDRKVEKVDLLT